MLSAPHSDQLPRRATDSFAHHTAPLVREMLHAMGQPLTTLQSCRLFAHRPEKLAAGNASLLQEMADQVDQVTELYRALRLLLDPDETLAAHPNERRPNLRETLGKRTPAWRRQASHQQVTLAIETDQDDQTAPRAPAEQALDTIFATVLTSVPPNGCLHIIHRAAHVRLAGGDQVPPGWAPAWTLRAAGTLLASCGARVRYTTQPLFCADLCFGLDPTQILTHE